MTQDQAMSRTTLFSSCRNYRYALWRTWGDGNFVMFIGLNPSTADETKDDPTIRRCVRFAKDWGYAALCMANLFAYRATQPSDMMRAHDPIGQDNDATLAMLARNATLIVAAWGTRGGYLMRDKAVLSSMPRLHVLGLTKEGYPSHPLYLPASSRPTVWDSGDSI